MKKRVFKFEESVEIEILKMRTEEEIRGAVNYFDEIVWWNKHKSYIDKHTWITTDWVVNNKKFKRPKKRYCKKCDKKHLVIITNGFIVPYNLIKFFFLYHKLSKKIKRWYYIQNLSDIYETRGMSIL
jgi:hypothetical protein